MLSNIKEPDLKGLISSKLIYAHEIGIKVVITLMNTFEVDEVDINNIEKNGYSTKGENRGLGLYNVKEILKKYRSVLKSTSVQDGFFVQSLVLQK